jgi:hypothetical protein
MAQHGATRTARLTGRFPQLLSNSAAPLYFPKNEFSIKEGFRILSAYHLKDDMKIWIITELPAPQPPILLPEEH